MSAVETASARIKETFPDIKPGAWHEKTNRVVHHSDEFPELAADLEGLFGPDWPTQLDLVGYNGTVNPEMILPAVLKRRTPVAVSWLSTPGLVAVSLAMGVALKSINDIWSWIIMGLGSGSLAAGMLRLHLVAAERLGLRGRDGARGLRGCCSAARSGSL